MNKKELQWHPGFQAALQVELEEDEQYLKFHQEYNLNELPLQIDTLVIKKDAEHRIRKSIGKLFRTHNIIEYKSPDDYVSVNDFYKVLGYACIYQSNTKRILEIHPGEITLTFVCSHMPRELIRHLKEQYKVSVTRMWEGIFYIENLMFPVQILISNRLAVDEYIWLSRLHGGLDLKNDIEPLARIYKKKKSEPLYEAVMNLIVQANEKQYKEGINKMCDALRKLFLEEYADELEKDKKKIREQMVAQAMEQGIEQGALIKLISLVRRKQQKGVQAALTAQMLEEDEGMIARIYQCLAQDSERKDEEICKEILGFEG